MKSTDETAIPTLIVDDQEDIRLLTRVLIEAANDGLSVVGEASNGTEAIEQVKRHEPRVVVFDEMMPEMTGTEAVLILRETHPGQLTILCSAYIDERVIARARIAGVTACLSKDRIEELPDLIRAVVARG
jgi:DNA-binding NarL/FixJ family response regulator